MNKDFAKFYRSLSSTTDTKLLDYSKQLNYISPNIIDNDMNSGAVVDIFSRLLKDRIIVLGTEINDVVANIINSQILYLQMLDSAKDITMYINSGGGSVYGGLSILDTMDLVDNDIMTINTGLAASMSAVILSNGTKGKRFALRRSQTMIHQPIGYIGQAQAIDINIEAKHINNLKNELYETLSANTGKSISEISNDSDRDHWLSASETVKYGIIDEVITKKK